MRLIDADALRIVTQGKNHHRKYVYADITDAPTIDAIPVEWLRSQLQPYTNDWEDFRRAVNNGAIKGIITKWQYEQEAR